ncbi:MAG: FtsX-like permease family protein [Planctomycetota bacterium]|nr:FtsX-like permease family protein [Planctomycetota bacterium]
MNLERLVRRQALSHPVRALLTVGAVAVAMFLLCFLRSIVTSLDAAVKESSGRRIITASAVSLFQALPASYSAAIAEVDGVATVSRFTWFGGVYKDPENFFAQFGTDPQLLLDQYPEIELPAEHKQAWFDDKRGAIVGIGIAEKYGWSVGDTVPLLGTIFPRAGGEPWEFTVRGVYRSTRANVDEMTMYFHWTLLDEALESGESMGPRGTSVYLIRLDDGWEGEEVAQAIDDYYAGGPQRTRTQPEAAFQADFVNMMGNLPTFLGMIGAAVLVAILFGVVNTMTIAARERLRSMGILKAMGFSDRVPIRLYLMESTMLVLIGGGLGIGLAWLTQPGLRAMFGTFIPVYQVAGETYLAATVACVGIGLLAGLIPALRAARLRPVEALRRGA